MKMYATNAETMRELAQIARKNGYFLITYTPQIIELEKDDDKIIIELYKGRRKSLLWLHTS